MNLLISLLFATLLAQQAPPPPRPAAPPPRPEPAAAAPARYMIGRAGPAEDHGLRRAGPDQQLPGGRRRLHHVPLHRPRAGERSDAGGTAGPHSRAARGRLHQEPAGARRDRRVQEPERARERRGAPAGQDHDDGLDDAARGARRRRIGDLGGEQRADRRAPEEAGRDRLRRRRASTGRTCSSARAPTSCCRTATSSTCPKAQTFFITGQVRNGGPFVLEPGTTIQQAIAMAGGLSERGSDRGITVTRIGERQEHRRQSDARGQSPAQRHDHDPQPLLLMRGVN